MRRFGFYDIAALAVGIPFMLLALRLILGTGVDMSGPFWISAMVISNLIVARLFRKEIALREGPIAGLIAVGIGFANTLIFSSIAYPVVGLFHGFFFAISNLHVIAPLSIVALFVMRWADKHDRNSMFPGRVLGGPVG